MTAVLTMREQKFIFYKLAWAGTYYTYKYFLRGFRKKISLGVIARWKTQKSTTRNLNTITNVQDIFADITCVYVIVHDM